MKRIYIHGLGQTVHSRDKVIEASDKFRKVFNFAHDFVVNFCQLREKTQGDIRAVRI